MSRSMHEAVAAHHRLEALRSVDFTRLQPIEGATARAIAAAPVQVALALERARLVQMRKIRVALRHGARMLVVRAQNALPTPAAFKEEQTMLPQYRACSEVL